MEYKEIKKLMDDMGNSKLSEIEIEFPDGIKISMKKGLPSSKPAIKEESSVVVKPSSEVPAVKEKTEVTVVKNNEKIITAPMVGTFYSRVSPKDEPYVSIGSVVKKGNIVCIIEAMKLMNEIESELDGEIVEILCKDGDLVEYGQPLFKLK